MKLTVCSYLANALELSLFLPELKKKDNMTVKNMPRYCYAIELFATQVLDLT